MANFILKDGTLVPETHKDFSILHLFSKQIKEGTVVTAFFDEQESHGSVSLNAKVHKMIRTLCLDTGYEYKEMKELVKKEAGLLVWTGNANEYKSFKLCSKDELALAIQACVSIGITVGSPIY